MVIYLCSNEISFTTGSGFDLSGGSPRSKNTRIAVFTFKPIKELK